MSTLRDLIELTTASRVTEEKLRKIVDRDENLHIYTILRKLKKRLQEDKEAVKTRLLAARASASGQAGSGTYSFVR